MSKRNKNLITKAIEIVGLRNLADLTGVTYQAVRKWEANNKLPYTEWTQETNYAEIIHEATNGEVSKHDLVPQRYPNKAA